MMHAKVVAVLLLVGLAVAGAQSEPEQPTVFAALQVTPAVSKFWASLAQVRNLARPGAAG